MNEDKSFSAAVGKLVIILPIAILVSFYKVFILSKLIEWYNIPIHLTFAQILGLLFIYNIVTYKSSEDTKTKSIPEYISDIIIYVLLMTVVLGVYYLIHVYWI